MYSFGKVSLQRLETCHIDLQILFKEVIKWYDISILCGARGKEDQNKAFAEGKSQRKWPQGEHNALIAVPEKERHMYKLPPLSLAVDWAPYPISWKPEHFYRFAYVAGAIVEIGKRLFKEYKISSLPRSGFDWDGDGDFTDQSFNDGGHTELWFPPPGFVLAA